MTTMTTLMAMAALAWAGDSREDSVRKLDTLKMIDVRSLMVKLQDFAGPKVDLVGASTKTNLTNTGIFILEEPKPPLVDDDMMITLIKENTGSGSWDNPKAAISMNNGVLVI